MNKFYKGLNRRNTSCYKWDIPDFKKDNVLPFWIADSDYLTCDCIIEDLVARSKQGAFGYTFVDEEYYQIVQNWISNRYGYSIKNDWIVTTPGVVNALYLIIKLFTKEQDKVVVSTPVYNPFFNVVNNNNRILTLNPLIEDNDTYKIDFIDLENKLKEAKVFIFCNPHNPIGRVWNQEEVSRVVNLCKKYEVLLISDEIHCDFVFDNKKVCSVGNYLTDYENIVVCTAPSKTFNVAGLMDSNIIIRNEKIRNLFCQELEFLSIKDPNIFGLVACKSAYSKGSEWVDWQNKYLEENRDLVYEYFLKNIPEAKLYKLEGTYLMWINLSYLGLSQDELHQGLFDNGVLVNNGTMYGEKYIGYIRLNIACGREQLTEGLKRIKSFIEKRI